MIKLIIYAVCDIFFTMLTYLDLILYLVADLGYPYFEACICIVACMFVWVVYLTCLCNDRHRRMLIHRLILYVYELYRFWFVPTCRPTVHHRAPPVPPVIVLAGCNIVAEENSEINIIAWSGLRVARITQKTKRDKVDQKTKKTKKKSRTHLKKKDYIKSCHLGISCTECEDDSFVTKIRIFFV